MKNLLFIIFAVLALMLVGFAAYNKIMFGDSRLLFPALIYSGAFSIVTLIDLGISILKKNETRFIWLLFFIHFSGIAQLVYYSKKLLKANR